MKLADIFCHDSCQFNLDVTDKASVLSILGEQLYQKNYIQNLSDFIVGTNQRESLGTTYIGNLIAIPHYQSEFIKKSSIIIAKTKKTIDWDPIMNFKVQYIVLFAVSMGVNNQGESVLLSQIIELFMTPNFIKKFCMTNSGTDVLALLKKEIY